MKKEIKYFIAGFAISIGILVLLYLTTSFIPQLDRNENSKGAPDTRKESITNEKVKDAIKNIKGPENINKARKYAEAGAFLPAIKTCDRIISRGKVDDGVLVFQAECYNQIQEYQKAADNCISVLKKSPSDTWALRTLGATLQKQKKYADAIDKFNQVIKLDNSKGRVDAACSYFALGMIDKENGNIKGAIKNVKIAVKMFPANEYFSDNLEELEWDSN
jgi:tetratricopeptide (TPR) repeat protein